jgi:AraC-like DNA-binding protein
MDIKKVLQNANLESYVREIFVFDNDDETASSLLPFIADGYPGIMLQQTNHGAFLIANNKELSPFFMYGQTLKPIEIAIKGAYRLIVFQLYPFAAKTLFGVNPKELNDDCQDLNALSIDGTAQVVENLFEEKETINQINIIAAYLAKLIVKTISHKEQNVRAAISLVVNNRGNITVKAITEHLHITERTLQRQFEEYVGIPPKQFAKIIQFQSSLNQISEETFTRFTEIVYENGYADQSHFIRSFKKFAGKNPSLYKSGK